MTQLYRKQGSRYKPITAPLLTLDGGLIVIGGLRYALGRSSYMPGSVMDWINENWTVLNINTKFVLLRDTVSWLADRHLFDKPDEPRWMDYRERWSTWADLLLAKEESSWARTVVLAALYSPESRNVFQVKPFLKYIQESNT